MCGSDNVTYGNDCELENAVCTSTELFKVYDGPCQGDIFGGIVGTGKKFPMILNHFIFQIVLKYVLLSMILFVHQMASHIPMNAISKQKNANLARKILKSCMMVNVKMSILTMIKNLTKMMPMKSLRRMIATIMTCMSVEMGLVFHMPKFVIKLQIARMGLMR